MAEFFWAATPRFGTCLTCGTSVNDRGFIDMVSDTVMRTEAGEINGVVDMILCANCILQASRLVGGAMPNEVDDLVHENISKTDECEKLKDEIKAWQERFEQVVNLSLEDLRAIEEYKKAQADEPTSLPK